MKARMSIKNIIFIMLAIVLVSMFFINICFAANTGKISVDTAKLREQPNTDANVLELISKGEKVEIIENKDGWYKVNYKKMTGYLRTDLVETSNDTENNETTAVPEENVSNEQVSENTTTETSTEPIQEEVIEKGKQYKIVNNVKLKAIPLISAIELEEINKDAQVEVIELLNEWTKIKTAEGKEGWVRTANLTNIQTNTTENTVQTTGNLAQSSTTENKPTQTSKKMYVSSQTVNVREQASKSSKAVKQLSLNTEVTVMSTENGWSYVEVNGIKGYISASLLSSKKTETSRSSTTERTTTTTTTTTTATAPSGYGSQIVSTAKQYLGTKYVSGGTTPAGFDCSGFTQYVYRQNGISIPRTSYDQAKVGTAVSKDSLQPGDLVIYSNHVAIYVGNGQVIHSPRPGKSVCITSINNAGNGYQGARRVY